MAAGSEARGGTPKTPCRRHQATPPRSITCFRPDDTTTSLRLVWVPRRSEVAIARRSGPRRFPSSTVRQAAEASRVGARRRRSLRAHGTADREKDPAPNRPQPTRGRSVMKTRTRHLRASWSPSCQAVKVQGSPWNLREVSSCRLPLGLPARLLKWICTSIQSAGANEA